MNNLSLIFKVLSVIFLFSFNLSAKEVNSDFEIWVNDLKKAVQDKNYEQDFIDEVFLNIYYSKEYIEEDKKQFRSQTFTQYYKNAINNRRIRKAKAKINKNNVILNKVESKFQVPKEYIVALWAIETDFGSLKGDFNVINSLANLSFNKRRRELFLNEFFAAIKIINDNNMNAKKLKGSWAGAIGQCQFLPSTYLKYGYDFDNDGMVDIWRNKSDIFASIAN
ncbi:lytic murein transglycosylase, partial [Rickettsiales bacterium]|nr:lytic murein transglycosylase [Rickettsiales bacterium]